MKQNIKMAMAICLAAVIVLAAVLVIQYLPSQNEAISLPEGEPPQWQVTVTGNVEQQKTLTLNEISEMPLTTVVTKVNGENVTYTGVTLFDFCNMSGMLWDAGQIEVIASDGHSATLNVFQAWNSTTYPYFQDINKITLVFVKDDQWMTEQTGGPVKLIAPYFSKEHQVEHVSTINIGLWTVSITGAVKNPITISSKNMTLFQQVTVEAEFVPGDGSRTSDWTGLSVMDILEAANMSYRAEKIVVFAIDDYSRNYTLQEIEEAQMLVGYQENGEPLSQNKGGPFRMFLPVDKYKWAQFWVKFVTEIRVY
ncbi:MAG: molybdopterin-dependent oxidoreductase [Candidatus Bathyarchaeota archaeon]|nr:molybdopterin-dependent oxidoreductase [Candidatus Bathyarchaeum sp.]